MSTTETHRPARNRLASLTEGQRWAVGTLIADNGQRADLALLVDASAELAQATLSTRDLEAFGRGPITIRRSRRGDVAGQGVIILRGYDTTADRVGQIELSICLTWPAPSTEHGAELVGTASVRSDQFDLPSKFVPSSPGPRTSRRPPATDGRTSSLRARPVERESRSARQEDQARSRAA